MTEAVIKERFKYAQNCLSRFDEFDNSATDSLRDEIDYMRRSILSCSLELLQQSPLLQESRHPFLRQLLKAISILMDLNSVVSFQVYLT
jgi:hypothetical protein